MKESEEGSLKSWFVPFTTTKAITFIILIGFAVYFTSFFNGFIADDNGQILDNALVHSIGNFFTFFSSGSFSGGNSAGIYYKPIFSIVLSSIYSFFGPIPFFFHFVQLLIHIANASLVYILFSKVLKKYYAFFLTLVFLIHPINSEAVVYISATQEVLFFFFGIIALILSTKKNLKFFDTILAHVLLLFSLLSKETGVLFVLMCTIYILVFNRKNFYIYVASSVIVGLIYSFLRFIVAGIYFNGTTISPIMEAPIQERLLSMPSILYYYMSTFFFPKALLFNQQWVIQKTSIESFYTPLIVVLTILFFISLVVVRLLKFSKTTKLYTIFFSVWFVCGIIFHIQLFPLDGIVADRWFYFTMVGLLGIIGLFIQNFYKLYNFKHERIVLFIASFILIFTLSTRTIVRTTNWKSPILLYTHDLKLKPNFSLENALAFEYSEKGDLDKAYIHSKRSVEIYPSFANLTNLGAVYARQGKYKDAKKSYLQAIEKGKTYFPAYENMILILLKHFDEKEAQDFTRKTTEIFPTTEKAWFYRLVAEYKAGEQQEALNAAEKYYLISNSQQAQDAYLRLLNNQPLNIEFK